MLKAKIREVDTLLEQMRTQANNKKSESYPVVLSYPLEIREEGKRNRTDNKAVKSRKRTERRKIKEKKRFLNNIKSRNQHIKNLSNSQLTDEQITLLSHCLKFIPTPVTTENIIRRQLLNDFSQFARRMRLKETRRNCSPIGHNKTKHFLCPIRSRHPLEFLEIVR